MIDQPLPADVRIGHVHLRVADLERAIAFYRDTLGFALRIDGRSYGLPMVFLAAGDYHHHIALNTFESAGGTPPPAGHTGLFHVALVYPDRASLAGAVARAVAHGATFDGGRDHGGTVSIYLKDPDGNGIELYYDVPMARWFDEHGRWNLKNDGFDPLTLLADAVPAGAAVATA
ncbi:MAG: VOC family protein [Vicinamibacteraceae bacterium]